MKYKIMRVFTVDASSKQEAVERLKTNPANYLDYESIKELEAEGIGQAVKRQVFGK
jgi:hypothetical protein